MKINFKNFIPKYKNISHFQNQNLNSTNITNENLQKQTDYFKHANVLGNFKRDFIVFSSNKWVTEKNKEEIINLYNEGKTQAQIADIFDCDPTTIGLALKRWEIPSYRISKNKKIEEQTRSLIEQGKTVKEISVITGIPINKLRGIISNHDIEYGGFAEINKDKIMDLYNQGLNYSQIASIMGCTHATVRYSFKKWGIEYESFSERNSNKVIELYNEGKSASAIADDLGCAKATVKNILKRNGIEYKSQKGKK